MPNRKRVFHVYVIELDDEVREVKEWQRRNPNQEHSPCFYVGASGHSPTCRLNQHLHATTQYSTECICEFNIGRPVKSRGNKYVRKYCIDLADPSFRPKKTVFRTMDEAVEAEEAFAKQLREEGYGAWQG